MRMVIGVICRILATMSFAAMMLLVQASLPVAGAAMTYFLRGLFAIPVILLVMMANGAFPSGVTTSRPAGHIVRGFLAASSLACTFAALSLLPVSVAAALTFLAPLFVAMGAVIVLKERVSARCWIALLLGGLGVVIALGGVSSSHGSAIALAAGVGIGVLGAALMAASMIQLKRLAITDSAATLSLYFSLAIALAGLAAIAYEGSISSAQLPATAVLAGLTGAAGQLLLAESMRRAPASQLAPYDYLLLVWAMIWDLAHNHIGAGSLVLWSPVLIGLSVAIMMVPRREANEVRVTQVREDTPGSPPL